MLVWLIFGWLVLALVVSFGLGHLAGRHRPGR